MHAPEDCGDCVDDSSYALVDAAKVMGGTVSFVLGRGGVATTMQSASSGPVQPVRRQLAWQLCGGLK